jgi:hypothetical protein
MASSPRVQHILSLAAGLSREECEEVAAELLSALEPGEALDADEWDDAWREEIARRSADRSPGVPLARVRERVNEALSAARLARERR